jgi:hypothetical protein
MNPEMQPPLDQIEGEPTTHRIAFAAVQAAFSEARLDAFRDPNVADEPAYVILGRYAWNVNLGLALTPALHTAEIALRNTIYTAGDRSAGKLLKQWRPGPMKHGGIPCWLDLEPTVLTDIAATDVASARDGLKERGKPPTPGRLIAELNFAFWVHLFDHRYDQGSRLPNGFPLWTADNLKRAFPNAPSKFRTREALRERFDEIRLLRNRISHHEPIFRQDLDRVHRRLIAAIEWMNLDAARLLVLFDRFVSVWQVGSAPFEEQIRRLLIQ